MVLSDLIPLILFISTGCTLSVVNHPNTPTSPPPLWGPIISRLFSLLYHACQPSHPALIALDHLGICSMAFSVPAACALAGWGDGACAVHTAATAIVAGCAAAEVVVHGVRRRGFIFRDAEHALVALALIGNAPVVSAIVTPAVEAHRRVLLAFSLASFAIGYFLLKPRHHVLWHWAAAAAQAAGVAAVLHGTK